MRAAQMYFSSTVLTSIIVITKHLNLCCSLKSQLYGQITFILFFIQWTVSIFHVRQHFICSALSRTARRPVHLSIQNVIVLVVLLYFWFPQLLCKRRLWMGEEASLFPTINCVVLVPQNSYFCFPNLRPMPFCVVSPGSPGTGSLSPLPPGMLLGDCALRLQLPSHLPLDHWSSWPPAILFL